MRLKLEYHLCNMHEHDSFTFQNFDQQLLILTLKTIIDLSTSFVATPLLYIATTCCPQTPTLCSLSLSTFKFSSTLTASTTSQSSIVQRSSNILTLTGPLFVALLFKLHLCHLVYVHIVWYIVNYYMTISMYSVIVAIYCFVWCHVVDHYFKFQQLGVP